MHQPPFCSFCLDVFPSILCWWLISNLKANIQKKALLLTNTHALLSKIMNSSKFLIAVFVCAFGTGSDRNIFYKATLKILYMVNSLSALKFMVWVTSSQMLGLHQSSPLPPQTSYSSNICSSISSCSPANWCSHRIIRVHPSEAVIRQTATTLSARQWLADTLTSISLIWTESLERDSLTTFKTSAVKENLEVWVYRSWTEYTVP